MTIKELAQIAEVKIIAGKEEDLNREVTGVYACDLLSHAMAKVNRGDLWITVHTNLNVIAVASLTDAACVLIPENISVEPQTIDRAIEKEVVVLSSPDSSATVCHKIVPLFGKIT